MMTRHVPAGIIDPQTPHFSFSSPGSSFVTLRCRKHKANQRLSRDQLSLPLFSRTHRACPGLRFFTVARKSGHTGWSAFQRRPGYHTNKPSHKLAPISGSIEQNESPLAAAWRELEEETTLTPRDIELWRQGKPYTFSDESIGRQWTIYPFGFELKDSNDGGRGEKGIKIDWEHVGWEWHDPNDVKDDEQFGGVPRLAESLHRVWFEARMNPEASQALRSGLEALKNDHQSGSRELTTIALKAFREVLMYLCSDEKWWETARMAAWHLWKNGRESMGAATLNAFLGVLADIEGIVGKRIDCESRWDRVLAVVDHHLENRRTMSTQIKDSFAAYLEETFLTDPTSQSASLTLLTLSASSTIRDSILDAFAALPIWRLDLRILESRPLFEGASMASSLISEFQSKFASSPNRQMDLTIYTDASAALAATDVDFVLLGADRISSSGWICNKMGSLPAVLSAKHVSPIAKVLIFSELEKVAEPGVEGDHRTENNNPFEVMTSWLENGVNGVKVLEEALRGTHSDTSNCHLNVKNVYFEWVPANLIDAYISEEGVLDLEAIRKKSQQVKEKLERYFGNL